MSKILVDKMPLYAGECPLSLAGACIDEPCGEMGYYDTKHYCPYLVSLKFFNEEENNE